MEVEEWWTSTEVLEYLASQGQESTLDTWGGYYRRGQAPAPERKVGRTLLWRPPAIREWSAARPGPGNWSRKADVKS